MTNLETKQQVVDNLHAFMKNNHLVCAICAAPMVLGKLGYLKGRNYTCFAGCNEGLIGNYTAKEVEIDGNIITGRSMKYSVVFGLTILEKVAGLEIKNKVATAIDGL